MVFTDCRAWFRDLFRIDGNMSKLREIKRGVSARMDMINDTMVSYNIQRYYPNLAKERGITYPEAVALCASGNDPEASLGLKLADPGNQFMCISKKGKEKFKKTLSPEELEIFSKDEKNLKKALIRGARGKAV